ncbi:alpha/beta hydrolase family protein [Halalkalicoccus jeotgali]|uniref:Dipeptidyl aminopeptidase/acylaminoacyl peptidase n=1 Tax=Halalkalicoccus jeotgali (strain DSM 18796 / CECT 7217 / JCM 14584 / KCTC 4019 / B3) TaxID=795797 RepID=D8J7F7_HALJB|nr:alpha/beta hydrolase [Halalkalicoccus jeotgali]ADJ14052.1 dipeptidyl aminopeptidase/acylaminoacyl peptidase [Halalkalicoccus jeotgali B3]ELY33904.1 dipeptidyl aminopeptidase/acylaminoacyl peptidase [Halalkalicoccus jeotgali B3]
MRVHFSTRIFDYQTLRTMAYTTFGGAEPGEVLTTVERIEEGETASWHAEWRETAERTERAADEAAAASRHRTARFAYLRAHNYYRTAEFFLSARDPRRRPTYERCRETFRAGVALLDAPPRRVDLPYEDTTLPGYLFEPPERSGPGPTVICLGGFDSLAEELYFLCGVPEALARGYTVLLFDGPGQGAPLRQRELTARPDWERVVGPVIDALSPYGSVDPDRIGVIGVSFGGYYAPRAAAYDGRIAACVAFDHMHDLWRASAYEHPRLAPLLERVPDVTVNALATAGERFSVEARWLMENSRWVFGVESAAELQRTLRRYSLSGVAGRIDCPMLVLAGEDDHFVPLGLAEEFLEELRAPTTARVFKTEEGAGEHCQVGNLRLATSVVYDWLDETLAGGRENAPSPGPARG